MYNILFYTKDIVQIFIKNNIQVLSDTLHDLFNIYSMFINNEQFVLVSIFPFGTSQNILPKKDKNQIITFNKINNFGSYLASLIESVGFFMFQIIFEITSPEVQGTRGGSKVNKIKQKLKYFYKYD